MRILLTNDDGIDAPGLAALAQSVQLTFADAQCEIFVVAPDRGRSECSHSVTGDRPLVLKEVKENWFSVDGTPVDCVRVALTTLMPSPTFVLSGINAGANLGVNLMVSGTFAAAREAAVHQVSAMAISHYRRPDVPKTWDHTHRWLQSMLHTFAKHVETNRDKTTLWNLNLPAIDPNSETPLVKWCEVDQCPIERKSKQDGELVSFELDFHKRARVVGTDVDLCFSGFTTVSDVAPHFFTGSNRNDAAKPLS